MHTDATPSSIDITSVLSHYDLPDLSASLAPRPQLLLGAVGPLLQPLTAAEADTAFAPARAAYVKAGHSASLQIKLGSLVRLATSQPSATTLANPFAQEPRSVAEAVSAWLRSLH